MIVLTGWALCTAGAVTTDTPSRPYEEIVSRNVFGLKPPPPPPNPEDNKPPPPNITLTGITTVVGKKALMETPPPAIKPGTPAGTAPPGKQFYMLGEGEREGEIEVIAIDEVLGSVKVKNGAQEVTLTFEKNGVKPPTSAPVGNPGALPGLPGAPGMIPPPAAMPASFTPMPTGVKPEFPVRPMRGGINQSSFGAPGNPGFQPAGNGFQSAGFPLPASSLPGNSVTAGSVPLPSFTSPQNQAALSQAAMPDRLYSAEEQPILIEANRQKSPFAALLPPTPLYKGNVEGANPAGDTTTAPQQQRVVFPPLPGQPQFPPMPGAR